MNERNETKWNECAERTGTFGFLYYFSMSKVANIIRWIYRRPRSEDTTPVLTRKEWTELLKNSSLCNTVTFNFFPRLSSAIRFFLSSFPVRLRSWTWKSNALLLTSLKQNRNIYIHILCLINQGHFSLTLFSLIFLCIVCWFIFLISLRFAVLWAFFANKSKCAWDGGNKTEKKQQILFHRHIKII